MIIHIMPADGRDYKTRGAAQKDWDANNECLGEILKQLDTLIQETKR